MALLTASAGLILAPDTSPYTSGAMGAGPLLIDGNRECDSATGYLMFTHYSFGLDMGSAMLVDILQLYSDIPYPTYEWPTIAVYKSADNSTWTEVTAITIGTPDQTVEGYRYLPVTLTGGVTERYFKMVVTTEPPYLGAASYPYVGEMEAYSASSTDLSISLSDLQHMSISLHCEPVDLTLDLSFAAGDIALTGSLYVPIDTAAIHAQVVTGPEIEIVIPIMNAHLDMDLTRVFRPRFTGYSLLSATLTVNLPNLLRPRFTAVNHPVGRIEIHLPRFNPKFRASSARYANLDMTLPVVRFSFTGAVHTVANLSIVLPRPRYVFLLSAKSRFDGYVLRFVESA